MAEVTSVKMKDGSGKEVSGEKVPSPESPGEENTMPPSETPPAVTVPSNQGEMPPGVIGKAPNGGIHVEIPDDRIDHVVVKNGQGEEENGVTIDRELPAGNYGLTIIDGNDVPLGEYLFTIDESGVPLAALPKMGERAMPCSALVFIMLGGMFILFCNRRKYRKDDGLI